MQPKLTPAVKVLTILCVVLFLTQQTVDRFMGGDMIGWLGLIPSGFVMGFRFWQIITYSFLHADILHLVLNMMMLVFIGGELEQAWGTKRFLIFYTVCVVSAGLFYLVLQLWGSGAGLAVPMVGASGGIYGLLMAYGILFSERTLLFMMIFPLKAKQFVWILMGVEFFTTLFSGRAGAGLSSAAHLGGMIAGFSYLYLRATWILYQRRRKEGATRQSSPRRKTIFPVKGGPKNHLRLIIDNEKDEDAERDPRTWH